MTFFLLLYFMIALASVGSAPIVKKTNRVILQKSFERLGPLELLKSSKDFIILSILHLTFGPQNKLDRVNLLPALFSLPEELVGNSGCILSDFTSGVELHSKSIEIIQPILVGNLFKKDNYLLLV